MRLSFIACVLMVAGALNIKINATREKLVTRELLQKYLVNPTSHSSPFRRQASNHASIAPK